MKKTQEKKLFKKEIYSRKIFYDIILLPTSIYNNYHGNIDKKKNSSLKAYKARSKEWNEKIKKIPDIMKSSESPTLKDPSRLYAVF